MPFLFEAIPNYPLCLSRPGSWLNACGTDLSETTKDAKTCCIGSLAPSSRFLNKTLAPLVLSGVHQCLPPGPLHRALLCIYVYIYMYNSSQRLQSLSSALRGSAKRHARCPLFSQLGAVLVPRESSLLPADPWQGGMRTGRERSAHWRLRWHPSHVCRVLPVRKKGGNNCTTCNYLLHPQIFVENEFSQE